ncbi:MAG TPA: ATP synthase F1 subunit delta [Haloplasmataceae bacterium]
MTNDYAKEYAIALFDLALEKNILDIIVDEFIKVTDIINEEKSFIKLLTHPELSKQEKKEIIGKTFNSVNSTLMNFLNVIVENNRFIDVDYIKQEFVDLYNDYLNIMHVEARTSTLLTSEQINLLEKKLERKYRHKIQIENIIDKNIIGGVMLKINNQIIDYTIKTQLQSLKSHILKQT